MACEMAQHLKAQAGLPEELGLIPRTHMATNLLKLQFQGL